MRVGDPVRRLGFAEFGPPEGRPIVWLHGTPGGRRQIPQSARFAAEALGLRIVGIDRPGIGSSTPHRYGSVLDFVTDLTTVCDHLGFERFAVIGLSGGGPYALASCYALPDRVAVGGVLGGVAPARGDDAHPGASSDGRRPSAPCPGLLDALVVGADGRRWALRPVRSPAFDLYARISPEGDQRVFAASRDQGHVPRRPVRRKPQRHRRRPRPRLPPLHQAVGLLRCATSLCPCDGGTAMPTTSSRWPMASTWCRSFPTPSSTCDRARATSVGSAQPRRC